MSYELETVHWSSRRGATLLLAVIILGTISAASIAISAIVTQSLRSEQLINEAIIASYSAESGIEELLYLVRKQEQEPVDAQKDQESIKWTRTIIPPPERLYINLGKDAVEQVDVPGTARYLDIYVSHPDCGTADKPPCAFLDVTWTAFLNTGATTPVEGSSFIGAGYRQVNPVRIDLAQLSTGGAAVSLYRVRLRSSKGAIGELELSVSDEQSQTVSFESRIRIVVTGEKGRVKQAYRVDFPARAPLAPVFDYVLFSECDIVKGDVPKCPN